MPKEVIIIRAVDAGPTKVINAAGVAPPVRRKAVRAGVPRRFAPGSDREDKLGFIPFGRLRNEWFRCQSEVGTNRFGVVRSAFTESPNAQDFDAGREA